MAKLSILIAVLASLMVGVGCETSTVAAQGNKLRVMKPAEQTIKRGDTNDVKITIKRDDVRDPVTVKFEGQPAGVRVQDESRQIAAEETSATFTLRAEPDASVTKDQVVYVTVSG